MPKSFDLETLRAIPIREVAERLGLEVHENRNSHCFNSEAHARGDRNPSLSFGNRRYNRFKCFSCGITGSTIDLVSEVLKLSFAESCEWLGNSFNVTPTSNKTVRSGGSKPNLVYHKSNLEKVRVGRSKEYSLAEFNEVWQVFYDTCDPANRVVRDWWASRGLSEELLEAEGIRIITRNSWEKFNKLVPQKEALDAGLLKIRNGKVVPTFLRDNFVVFPYFAGGITSLSPTGRKVLGFKVRSLAKKPYAKYLSPVGFQPPVYRCHDLFLWLCDACNSPLYVTESETDALAVAEYLKFKGLKGYAVALPGGIKNESSLVVRELVTLMSASDNPAKVQVKVVTDNDEVGEGFFDEIRSSLYVAGVALYENITKFQPYVKLGLKDMGDYLVHIKSYDNYSDRSVKERKTK